MIIKLDQSGSAKGFRNLLEDIQENDHIKSCLILAADENGFTPKNIDSVLTKAKIPVFGGIFPEIIFKNEKLTKGTIIAGFDKEPMIQTIPHLSDLSIDYEEEIDITISDKLSVKTLFVFVDGFSKRISSLTESLFNVFGLNFNYIGGGCGSLSMEQKPCLFTNDGLLMDCAVLTYFDMPSGVGVSHGWESISGPYKVTDVDRNIVKTLDYKPAFQIYKSVVEAHGQNTFTDDNFFSIAKGYPLGIAKLGAERIVRDPFMVGKEDSLVCIGEVPKDSFVDILAGQPSSLITAAKTAFEKGNQYYTGDVESRSILFIDCISRVLFLEEQFSEEIHSVNAESLSMVGALTIGEIANSGNNYLEFYNKTAVVGILES